MIVSSGNFNLYGFATYAENNLQALFNTGSFLDNLLLNHLVVKLGKNVGIFLVTLCTLEGFVSVLRTGGLFLLYRLKAVSGCSKGGCVRESTVLTAVYSLSVGSTCSLGYLSLHIVTGCLGGNCLFGLVTTYAYLKIISVLSTAAGKGLSCIVVTVKLTSLCGSKSGNGVVGEVVSLECYVTVVVCSHNGLKLTVICDEPDCDTVNVIALLKSVGQSNGYIVVLTKVRNVARTVVNGEVVNRTVSNLTKLIGVKKSVKIVVSKLLSRDGNRVVSDRINYTLVEADVSIVKLNLGVLKIVGIDSIGGCTLEHGNLLCFRAVFTAVGSNPLNSLALDPVMSCAVLFNALGITVTACAGKSLYTVVLTGGGGGDLCNVVVVVNVLALNLFTALVTCVDQNALAGRTTYVFLYGCYVADAVTMCFTDCIGVSVSTCAKIGFGSRIFTICLGSRF